MLETISHVFVFVRDQDEAKAWYTEKLGFEVRQDATLDGGYRWLALGVPDQPDDNVVLIRPGAPLHDPETAEQLLGLVAKGALGPGIFHTGDCRATCKEIETRGVELTQQPDERFYGIDAAVRDPSGNPWRIIQPIEFDPDEIPR